MQFRKYQESVHTMSTDMMPEMSNNTKVIEHSKMQKFRTDMQLNYIQGCTEAH